MYMKGLRGKHGINNTLVMFRKSGIITRNISLFAQLDVKNHSVLIYSWLKLKKYLSVDAKTKKSYNNEIS